MKREKKRKKMDRDWKDMVVKDGLNWIGLKREPNTTQHKSVTRREREKLNRRKTIIVINVVED